jgi:hypothetical protein
MHAVVPLQEWLSQPAASPLGSGNLVEVPLEVQTTHKNAPLRGRHSKKKGPAILARPFLTDVTHPEFAQPKLTMELLVLAVLTLLTGILTLTVRILLLLCGLLAATLLLTRLLPGVLVLLAGILVLLAGILVLVRHTDLLF